MSAKEKKHPMKIFPPAVPAPWDKIIELLNKFDAKLQNIIDLMKEPQPQGYVEPQTVAVDTSGQSIKAKLGPWFSVTMVNDGPNTVDVTINPSLAGAGAHPVLKDETYRIEMGRPLITDIDFKCAAGTASVRFVGVR